MKSATGNDALSNLAPIADTPSVAEPFAAGFAEGVGDVSEPNTPYTVQNVASELFEQGAVPGMTGIEEAQQLEISLNESSRPLSGLGLDEQVQDQLEPAIQMLLAGGPIVWLLIALSVFSTGIILLKLWQFARLSPESFGRIRKSLAFWNANDRELAIRSLKPGHRVQVIVLQAMRGIAEHKTPERLQPELARQANALLHEMRLYLRPLEIIANLSPLLGLMGTVVGMIIAFQQMEAAGSQVDPSVLSGGIWQALLTTAAGLAVAIPVAAAHSYFERKVERVSHAINDIVTQVFTTGQHLAVSPVTQLGGERAA